MNIKLDGCYLSSDVMETICVIVVEWYSLASRAAVCREIYLFDNDKIFITWVADLGRVELTERFEMRIVE